MKEIKFVDVGEGITEGHIRKWLVKDGDNVKEDQSVVQVETDKAVVNVPSPISGMLKINAPENTVVYVGDSIAYIGTPAELQAAPKPQHVQPKQEAVQQPAAKPAVPVQQPAASQAGSFATPAIRKLAHDLNVDLSKISGTGPGGRILESDVRGAAHGTTPQPGPMPKEQYGGEVVREPMSQLRKVIAKNMELSWTIPRAVHMDTLNATQLAMTVARGKPGAEKMGIKLTFLPFIIKAVIEALKENPHFNASYDRDAQQIIVKKYYNIGLAAEAPDGLKVMVIKDADKKSIMNIAKEIQEMHKKILDGTISLSEMRDSTFTITNIGSLGGGFLSVPMINYPEVAILGVHMIKDTPVIVDGMVKIGKVLPISLSFDHRVVDGAEAVLFCNAIIKYLENPDFLEMLG
jgi:pyruvate dehydrogenase E2 component (dihydrolipoamide acetyltransferase)